jgi:hypothetical protein
MSEFGLYSDKSAITFDTGSFISSSMIMDNFDTFYLYCLGMTKDKE